MKVLVTEYPNEYHGKPMYQSDPMVGELVGFLPAKYSNKAIVKVRGVLMETAVHGLKVVEDEEQE